MITQWFLSKQMFFQGLVVTFEECAPAVLTPRMVVMVGVAL